MMLSVPLLADPPFAPPAKACVTFELHGEPKGKGRPRFSRRSGHAYTPAQTVTYESAVRLAGQTAMLGRELFSGPLAVTVQAIFAPAPSWPLKRQAAALLGLERPTKKPDADNIVKMLDALNGVVWVDDKQIVSLSLNKRYAKAPLLRVTVEAL